MKRGLLVLRFRPIGLPASLALALLACSPRDASESASSTDMGGMMGNGMMQEMPMMRTMPDWMMSGEGMMGLEMMRDMRPIRALLINHEKIERQVEDVPDGVPTTTTSNDPEIAEMIRIHVRQMRARYERGQPIRMMDPVFGELFRNRERTSLQY